MVGKPPEHIKKTLQQYIATLKKNKGIIVLTEEIAEPKEQDGFWSTFAEVEILVEGIEKFVYICVSFSPANVEILEPKELTFTEKNLSDWLNELLSLLHKVGTKAKESEMNYQLILKSLNALVRNSVMLATEKEEIDALEIGKRTGIDQKTLGPFLEAMVKEKRITKKGEKYKKVGKKNG
jgi:hypothetical protein